MKKFLPIIFILLLVNCGGGGGTSKPEPTPTNKAPVITAIPEQSVIEGESLSITVSANDSDGSIASYQWSQVSGEPVNLQNTDTSTVSFSAPQVQINSEVTLEVTVTDNDGAKATVSIKIIIISNNKAPEISPVDSFSLKEGKHHSITISAVDSDGLIESLHWSQISGTAIELDNNDTNTVNFITPTVESDDIVILRVTATDNQGATSSLDIQFSIINLYSKSPHNNNFTNDQDLTNFYTFFDHQNINRIDIAITQQEWDAFIVELENDLKSDTYFTTTVTITSARGTISTIEETGFRIRGNHTRQIPFSKTEGVFVPVHFKLKFNETFSLEPDTLAYLERDERRFANLKALNLKNRQPERDKSQIRELYSYDLFNQIDKNAPLTGSAHIYLTIGNNTVDYGIYTAIEPIDKTFLRKRYGDIDNEGNLYKCLWQRGGPATLSLKHPDVLSEHWIGVSNQLGLQPAYDLKTNKNKANHDVLTNFILQLNSLNGDALKSYLDINFEVDNFLKYLAMNMLIGNPDDYWAKGDNYYLYFNNNGKIEFIPYDYDSALGGGWKPFNIVTADIYVWGNLSGPLSEDPYYDAHPLVDKLLDIESYRIIYDNYLALFSDPEIGNFNFLTYSKKFDLLRSLYDPDGDAQLKSDIPDNISSMMNEQQEYFETKINSVRTQLGIK